MFWIIFLLVYVISVFICALTFEINNIQPSFLTVFIVLMPVLNFLFSIAIIIKNIIKCIDGEGADDIQKIKELFK